MNYFLSFLFFLLSYSISAQVTTFEKRFDYGFAESFRDIKQTEDGGYIMLGQQGVSIGLTHMFLTKTDSLGNEEWHKVYDYYPDVYTAALEVADDGGFLLAGTINKEANQKNDAYVIRTNSLGDTLWTKAYENELFVNVNDIQKVNNNAFVITGIKQDLNVGSVEIYLIKIDNLGNLLWDHSLDLGFEQQAVNKIKERSNGNLLLVGSIKNIENHIQILLAETDSEGNILWTNNYGWDKTEFGRDVIEIEDGFIIVGMTTEINPLSLYDKFIIRTNLEGDTLWTRILDTAYEESVQGIIPTIDGGFIILSTDWSYESGNANASIEILKINNQGDVIWEEGYGGLESNHSYGIINTSDGGIAIVGNTNNLCIACSYFLKVNYEGIMLNLNRPRVENKELSIYPNPSDGIFNIKFENEFKDEFEYTLFDSVGRIVFQKKSIKNHVEIDISYLSSGIYFLNIRDKTGNIISRKIVRI